MSPFALIAGIVCAAIVIAYFIALDQVRATTSNGGHVAAPPRPFVKQLV